MKIINFDKNHIERAKLIAVANYNEEREHVQSLPSIGDFQI